MHFMEGMNSSDREEVINEDDSGADNESDVMELEVDQEENEDYEDQESNDEDSIIDVM